MLARRAIEIASLDSVLFIPTATPPHKSDRALTAFEHRRRMVESAIAGDERFELSLVEGGAEASYTWQSVLGFAAQGYGRERLHLIVGSDSLAEMESWRRPEVIVEHATIIAMRREGSPRGVPVPRGAAVIFIETGANAISSSDVRARVAGGLPIGDLVPSAVARYIGDHRLYISPAGGGG